MDNFKVNKALELIDTLLFAASYFLTEDDIKEYREAYDTIVDYIKTYQTSIDDDWK